MTEMYTDKLTKPKDIEVKIPVRKKDKAVMYSMMDICALRKLHKFLGDLIEWKEAGGEPGCVEIIDYIISEIKGGLLNDQSK